MKTKNLKYTDRKAQQLAEFVLILPVFLIILVVIIELGFALNTRITLTEGVKRSVQLANLEYNQPGTTAAKKALLQNSIKDFLVKYFQKHNIPYEDTIDVEIIGINNSSSSVVLAKYSYTPVFILPNVLGVKIIPEHYNFSSYQIIDNALFQQNTHLSSFSDFDPGSFWKQPLDLDGRISLLKNNDLDGISANDVKKQTCFLVGLGSDYTYARLINWWGQDLLPTNLFINIDTGTLWVKTPYYNANVLYNTKIPYIWVLTSLGITNAIYIKDADKNPPLSSVTSKLDLASPYTSLNLSMYWCNQDVSITGDCDDDISSDSFDSLNKRGLSVMFNAVDTAFGSFEDVSGINTAIDYNDLYEHSYYYTDVGSEYLLKTFVPNNIKISDSYNGFRFALGINSSTGKYETATAVNTDILDCIMDNDGDKIPNAWDNDPQYPDVNGNGIIDGDESSVAAVTGLTDDLDISAGVCSGIAVKAIMPFNFSGNLSSNGKTYLPQTQDYEICTAGGAYYYKYGVSPTERLTRIVPTWSTTASTALIQKEKFLHGTLDNATSPTTILLDRSNELQDLKYSTNGQFNSSNRVTN